MHLPLPTRLAAAAAVALTLSLAVGCGNITTPVPSSSASGASTPATTGGTTTTPATPALDTGSKYATYYKPRGTAVTVTAGKAVAMNALDLYFDPNTLTVAKGTKVTINLDNKSPLAHNLTLDAFKVSTNIDGGKTVAITFTPTTAGTYYFYCNVPGHAQGGMVGKLTVQ